MKVIPPEMETRIDLVNADDRTLTRQIRYKITNYGSPAFHNGGRYGSGVLACSAIVDYGDGNAIYSGNYAAAACGYLNNLLTIEDTFIHEYAFPGEYRLTVSTTCEFTGTPLAPCDGPAATMTQDVTVGDNLTIVDFFKPGGWLQMDNFILVDHAQPVTLFDFESGINGDYDSLTLSEYNFMPL